MLDAGCWMLEARASQEIVELPDGKSQLRLRVVP